MLLRRMPQAQIMSGAKKGEGGDEDTGRWSCMRRLILPIQSQESD